MSTPNAITVIYYEDVGIGGDVGTNLSNKIVAAAQLPCIKEIILSMKDSHRQIKGHALRLNRYQYLSAKSFIDPDYQMVEDSYPVLYISKDGWAMNRQTLISGSGTNVDTKSAPSQVQLIVMDIRNAKDINYMLFGGGKATLPTTLARTDWLPWHWEGLNKRFVESIPLFHNMETRQQYYDQANRLVEWRFTKDNLSEHVTGELLRWPERWFPRNQWPITFDHPEDYHPMNASLFRDEAGGLLAAWRTVNYIHDNGYVSEHSDGHIRTKTFVAEIPEFLSNETNLTVLGSVPIEKVRELVNNVEYPSQRRSMVHNLEDQRMFLWNEQWWTVGTGIDTHYQQTHQMVLSRINERDAAIERMVMLDYDQSSIQKNWIPFPYVKDKMLLIYTYEPFTILEVDLGTGKCHPFLVRQQLMNCHGFRGSAIPTRYNDRYLMAVHRSMWLNKTGKNTNTYAQKLIEFDNQFRFTRASNYFKITNHPMEYVMGCHYNGKNLLMTLSENDANPSIVSFSEEEIEERLHLVM